MVASGPAMFRMTARAALLLCLAAAPHRPAHAAGPPAPAPSPDAKPAGTPAAPLPAEGATPASSEEGAAGRDRPWSIRLHVGVPGTLYIGQPLKDLLARFPKAEVKPYARQKDASAVTLRESRVSCIAVGPDPDSLRIASVGFDFTGPAAGQAPQDVRTSEGIGRGSTVEDLLRAYGTPSEITDERATKPLLRRQPPPDEATGPKKYLYESPDGAVSSYFLVLQDTVLRLVINDKAPLDRYIVRHRPGG